MEQSKKQSLLEAGIGTTVGFAIAWFLNWAIWRSFGFAPSMSQSFWVAVVFTLVTIIRVYYVRRGFNWWNSYQFTWDLEISNDMNGPTVLWIKHLWHSPRLGWRIDLHKFTAADAPNCFHTHPANAWRLPFWGGYREEVLQARCCVDGSWGLDITHDEVCLGCRHAKPVTYMQLWQPGNFGFVGPEFCHRVAELLNGRVSYSLWFRGRVTHAIKLCGIRDGRYVEEALWFNQEEAGKE